MWYNGRAIRGHTLWHLRKKADTGDGKPSEQRTTGKFCSLASEVKARAGKAQLDAGRSGRKIGSDSRTVRRWESGERALNRFTYGKLIDLFGASLRPWNATQEVGARSREDVLSAAPGRSLLHEDLGRSTFYQPILWTQRGTGRVGTLDCGRSLPGCNGAGYWRYRQDGASCKVGQENRRSL